MILSLSTTNSCSLYEDTDGIKWFCLSYLGASFSDFSFGCIEIVWYSWIASILHIPERVLPTSQHLKIYLSWKMAVWKDLKITVLELSIVINIPGKWSHWSKTGIYFLSPLREEKLKLYSINQPTNSESNYGSLYFHIYSEMLFSTLHEFSFSLWQFQQSCLFVFF